jgi:cytochrome P450
MVLLGWHGHMLRCARDPLRYLTQLHQTYGEVAVLERGGRFPMLSRSADCPGTVVAFGPRYNEEVLGQPDVFQIGLATGLEGTPLEHLGAGIFNTNAGKHKQVRREMAPAFHRKMVETYHQDLLLHTRQMLDEWGPGQRRDVQQEIERLVFRVACKTFLGLDEPAEVDVLGGLIRQWMKLSFAPAVRLLQLDLPFTPYRRFLKTSTCLDRALTRLRQRKKAGPRAENNLLGMLLHKGETDAGFLSEGEFIGQVLSLLIAAHDTTSAALSWTFFLLSQHPHVLADLVDELQGRLRGEAPTLEQLGRLPLLENVVKESLRLLPPVPVVGRVAVQPTRLGPYSLPGGTEVLCSQYVTHRLPEIYPQPAKFLPDRWRGLHPSPYEYLPFGAGPRRCLGASLASSQMKTILALVLQRYRLQLVPGARVDRLLRLTLQPKGGMPMLLWDQDRQFALSKTPVRGNVREMVDLS